MTRRVRFAVFATSAAGLATLLILAYLGMPHFGGQHHPYAVRAIHAAQNLRATANAVASVNFDQRSLDTLGEELIFFASVVGAFVLLRPGREEVVRQQRETSQGYVFDATRLAARLALPATLLIGGYIVIHGHISPGGGFQGGVILATALHLLYLGGDYASLRRLGPWERYEVVESLGAAGYLVVGIAGLIGAGAFLAGNVLPRGTFASLTSAGVVPMLNVAVGMEVAGGIVVLLSRYFEQEFEIRGRERR